MRSRLRSPKMMVIIIYLENYDKEFEESGEDEEIDEEEVRMPKQMDFDEDVPRRRKKDVDQVKVQADVRCSNIGNSFHGNFERRN